MEETRPEKRISWTAFSVETKMLIVLRVKLYFHFLVSCHGRLQWLDYIAGDLELWIP